jgi:hypothetical protein
MKILSIQKSTHKPSFTSYNPKAWDVDRLSRLSKSQGSQKVVEMFGHDFFDDSEEWNVIGYDDAPSKEARQFIRDHYAVEHNLPFNDIYENEPRLEEYSLEKLLNKFRSKPKKVDDEKLKSINLPMRKILGTNSYRGETLVDKPDYVMQDLKEAGIQTVVDLNGYGSRYKERVEKNGLNFHDFYMDTEYWFNSNKFANGKESKEVREPIDKLIKFIKVMQEDYVYIACEYGSYKTDDALILNNFFNAKNGRHPNYTRYSFQKDAIKKYYECLTDADKIKLGWTKEYEKQFLKRIKEAKVLERFF